MGFPPTLDIDISFPHSDISRVLPRGSGRDRPRMSPSSREIRRSFHFVADSIGQFSLDLGRKGGDVVTEITFLIPSSLSSSGRILLEWMCLLNCSNSQGLGPERASIQEQKSRSSGMCRTAHHGCFLRLVAPIAIFDLGPFLHSSEYIRRQTRQGLRYMN